MCVSFVCAASASEIIDVNIQNPLPHKLAEWGLYPVEFYYDTINDLPKIRNRLFKDLKPTLVKLRLQQALKKLPNSDLDQAVFRQTISTPVQFLAAEGIRYSLAVDSPPYFWKSYPTIDGHQDYNSARLLPNYEAEFVSFIVATIVKLRSERLPLPVGVCFQDSPSLKISRPPGCLYTAEQWFSVIRQLRDALNSENLNGVAIIGPDDLSLTQSMAFTAPLVAQDVASSLSPLGIFMTQLQSPQGEPVKAAVASHQEYFHRHRIPVWAAGAANYRARTEGESAITAAQSLAGSFADLEASAWIWRLGYSSEPSVECLVYGEEKTTLLYAFLETLWSRVRPGATIYPIRFNASERLASPYFGSANGVAFGVPEGRIYVLINPFPGPVSVRVDQAVREAWIFSDSTSGSVATKFASDRAGTQLALPPRSILIVATTPN